MGVRLGVMTAGCCLRCEGTSASDSPLNVGSRMLQVSWTRTCGYNDSNSLSVPVVGERCKDYSSRLVVTCVNRP